MEKGLTSLRVICLAIVFIVSLIGCNQKGSNESLISQKPAQESTASSFNQTEDIDWEDLEDKYNPPQVEGLLKAISNSKTAADGSVAITPDIKHEFNQMGEDYHFFFMPKVEWYDFEGIAYEGTGEALAYILFTWIGDDGIFPEKIPKYEAEARLRKIFAAPNNEYPPLEHKEYKKCVLFDGKTYSPWPESYNADRKIYDLTELKVRREGEYTYFTALCNEYLFDLTGAYEPTENEIFLNEQAKSLGLDKEATLSKLLETCKISNAPTCKFYRIEFRVKGNDVISKIISFDKGM